MDIKVKVEKTRVFKYVDEYPIPVYSHDIVYIYEKADKKYKLKATFEGKNLFNRITEFLKEHGKKRGGGKNSWTEYYEIDKYTFDEFLLTL